MKKLFIVFTCFLLAVIMLTNVQAREKPEKKQMKPALLVIDIQNKYLAYMSDEDKKNSLEMINWAIWLFRQYNLPVIRVYHTDPKSGPTPDSEEFKFPESIKITDDDPKVIKNFANAFKKTELKKLLDEKGCNTVFLCGLSAVGCVLATYFGAMDLDYTTFMVQDALLSHNAEYTGFVEQAFECLSLQTIMKMMEFTQ